MGCFQATHLVRNCYVFASIHSISFLADSYNGESQTSRKYNIYIFVRNIKIENGTFTTEKLNVQHLPFSKTEFTSETCTLEMKLRSLQFSLVSKLFCIKKNCRFHRTQNGTLCTCRLLIPCFLSIVHI